MLGNIFQSILGYLEGEAAEQASVGQVAWQRRLDERQSVQGAQHVRGNATTATIGAHVGKADGESNCALVIGKKSYTRRVGTVTCCTHCTRTQPFATILRTKCPADEPAALGSSSSAPSVRAGQVQVCQATAGTRCCTWHTVRWRPRYRAPLLQSQGSGCRAALYGRMSCTREVVVPTAA